jgi:hypothetical protein
MTSQKSIHRQSSERALSEKQELLLSRYVDDECGLFQSILAKRLIRRDPQAKDFINDLEKIKNGCTMGLAASRTAPVDLWDRINNRIIQEERAALYLGERRLQQSNESIWSRLQSPYALAGGLTGAACAALLLMVLYRPSDIVSFTAPHTAAMHSTMPHVQPVAVGSMAQRPRVAPALNQPTLEVDWMRSHGSVNVIPAPNGSSAIIWVRRRPTIPSRPQLRAVVRATPLSAARPNPELPRVQEWLDESVQPGAK